MKVYAVGTEKNCIIKNQRGHYVLDNGKINITKNQMGLYVLDDEKITITKIRCEFKFLILERLK